MKTISYFFTILAAIFIFLLPEKVLAAEVIRDFNVEILAHKDGTFNVTEKIDYDFGAENRHGIYRDIPLQTPVGDLTRVIEVDFQQILRDGNSENYSTTTNGAQASVKIGRADSTITGLHTYTISYLVKNGIGSNYEDHDELYWNVTGNTWQVLILKASAKIASDFDVNLNRATCFTGPLGSKLHDCDFSQTALIKTTRPLSEGEGLTAVWGFPKGTFPPSVLQRSSDSSSGMDPRVVKFILFGLAAIFVFLNFILAPALLFWYFKHKRKERFGPPSVNFDIPKDADGVRITPAEAGTIDNTKLDQNDVVATIFDLAIRRYLVIEQTSNKGGFLGIGSSPDYILSRSKEDDSSNLTSFERVVFNDLFKPDSKSIKLSDFGKRFYLTFSPMETMVFFSLVERGFYIKNPKNQRALLLGLAIILIVLLSVVLGLVLIFLSVKLNGRTAKGDKADWKIDGLKIFLKNMKRHYTWQTKNLITVEKYIPYAIAFGFIKEFMEELKEIYPDYNPTWYSGNTSFYLATGNMFSSMNSSFTTQAPSSSSGFSGGGSSGGGGGGGGGGSW